MNSVIHVRVIISAGGTGGHIYPALSILKKIKEKDPNSKVLYIGTTDRMESDIVPKMDIPYIGVNVIGLKKDFTIFKAGFLFLKAIFKCKKIIKEFKPDIVIGVGGYITAPVIYSAKKLGIKTVIHEQNSIPGKSNTFLQKYVDKIFVSLPGSKEYFKGDVVLTGNPRSQEAYYAKLMDKKELGFHDNKRLVLIVMGSLGSTTVTNALLDIVPKFKGKDYEVLVISGNNYIDKYPKNLPENVKVIPFLDNMVNLLKNVDVMVTRAGASTIAEILAIGLPSILVPSPYVANNHQLFNAKELVNNNSALLLEEKDFNSDNLLKKIDLLLNNSVLYKEISENAKKLGVISSCDKIYEEIKKILGG